MIRARLGRSRKLVPAVLALAGCSPPSVMDAGIDAGRDAGLDAGRDDAGIDAGYDAGLDGGDDAGCAPTGTCAPPYAQYTNACGQRCGCPVLELLFDGGMLREPYCDPDIGNPCELSCANPREADGGRAYYPNGDPQCLC